MQIIQVRPGADRAQLNETARRCGLKVGIQGGMQIVYVDSSNMGADFPRSASVTNRTVSASISD